MDFRETIVPRMLTSRRDRSCRAFRSPCQTSLIIYAFQLVKHAPQDLLTCLSAEDGHRLVFATPLTGCACRTHRVLPVSQSPPRWNSFNGSTLINAMVLPWFVALLIELFSRIVSCMSWDKRWLIFMRFANGMVIFDQIPDVPLTASSLDFLCRVCGCGFSSVQGLQAHQWRKHQMISEERRYVFDTRCRAWNRCFWTVQRLQQHLRWSRRRPGGCSAILQKYFQPLGNPVACGIPAHL